MDNIDTTFDPRAGSPREVEEPLCSILSQDEDLVVCVDIPGAKEEDIAIEANPSYIDIDVKGEKRYHKKVELPSRIEPGSVEKEFKNGVLTLSYSKKD